MTVIRKLEVEDLENLVVGATVLSSGGGGSADNALGLIRRIAKKGLVPELVDPKSLRSNDLIFAPGDVGGGITPEQEKRFEDVYKTKIPIKWKNWPWDKWSPASIVELAQYLQREPNAFLAIESGPGSFLSVIYEAAKAGKPTVDGDTVGRAVPEMTMSKLFLNNSKVLASASTSHFGDVIILKRVVDFRRMEDIVRSFASASGGGVGLVSAFAGSSIKTGTIRKSISRCIDLGAKVMSSREEDLTKTILRELGGRILFMGKVEKVEAEPKQGYLFGSYQLAGSGDFKGAELRFGSRMKITSRGWMEK